MDTFICIPYTTFSLKPSKFSVFQSISLNRIIYIGVISLPKSLRKLKKSPMKYECLMSIGPKYFVMVQFLTGP